MEMNEREEFVGFVCKTLNELKEQFIAKQQQYKTNTDPLANFRKGAALKEGNCCMPAMYECAKDYALKHVAHVYGHDINGEKVDESLKDIAIYSVIELYMVTKFQEAKREDARKFNASITKEECERVLPVHLPYRL